jgi:hypothetical protein
MYKIFWEVHGGERDYRSGYLKSDRRCSAISSSGGIVDVRGSVSSADRPRLIRDAEARILALEIGEERLVMAALDEGLEVHRRIACGTISLGQCR